MKDLEIATTIPVKVSDTRERFYDRKHSTLILSSEKLVYIGDKEKDKDNFVTFKIIARDKENRPVRNFEDKGFFNVVNITSEPIKLEKTSEDGVYIAKFSSFKDSESFEKGNYRIGNASTGYVTIAINGVNIGPSAPFTINSDSLKYDETKSIFDLPIKDFMLTSCGGYTRQYKVRLINKKGTVFTKDRIRIDLKTIKTDEDANDALDYKFIKEENGFYIYELSALKTGKYSLQVKYKNNYNDYKEAHKETVFFLDDEPVFEYSKLYVLSPKNKIITLNDSTGWPAEAIMIFETYGVHGRILDYEAITSDRRFENEMKAFIKTENIERTFTYIGGNKFELKLGSELTVNKNAIKKTHVIYPKYKDKVSPFASSLVVSMNYLAPDKVEFVPIKEISVGKSPTVKFTTYINGSKQSEEATPRLTMKFWKNGQDVTEDCYKGIFYDENFDYRFITQLKIFNEPGDYMGKLYYKTYHDEPRFIEIGDPFLIHVKE